MKFWQLYKNRIHSTFVGPEHAGQEVVYWKNQLFAGILVYMLPISLIALVPGVIMSLLHEVPLLAISDLLAALFLVFLCFNRKISINVRKALLIFLLYFLTISLLYFLGSMGPGLLYLLAVSVLTALICPFLTAIISVAINVLVCVALGFVIQYDLPSNALSQTYTLGSWIAVSSNVIFLSTVFIFAIHILFNGLSNTITKKIELQNLLQDESRHLSRMLDELEAKNRDLEQFAYIASHDLQEPLRNIAMLSGYMSEQFQGKLGEAGDEYLELLQRSSGRMRALVSGLLEYAKLGKEKSMSNVNVHDLLEDVLEDLSILIKESKGVIRVEKMPQMIRAYPVELKQVFQNLIMNALKFISRDATPEIIIRSEIHEGFWHFSVQDNGIGIDPQHQERIFVIFQRLHDRAEYEGAGIGLAHCRKIIELHGGKMGVISSPGEGSTFYFSIPK